MLSQQKADGDLLGLFGRVIAMVLLIILLGVLSFRYLGSMNNIAAQALWIDHSRFLNVLIMIKAKWLAQGKPKEMRLDWDTGGIISNNDQPTKPQGIKLVKMSSGGWPLPNKLDSAGCKQLWYQLLGVDAASQDIVSLLDPNGLICNYTVNDSLSLSYQLVSGRVVFVANDDKNTNGVAL
ncbi:MAG: hypothetical protein V5788_06810 [Shewanella sp.]